MTDMSRRRMLTVSLGTAAVAGAGLLAAPAAQAATASPKKPACPGPYDLPPVPGMRGDRLANEVWYQLDEATEYQAAPEFTTAIQAVIAVLKAAAPGVNPEISMPSLWISSRQKGTYPDSFVSLFEPVRDSMEVISATQVKVFETYYHNNWWGLTGAMADFGQGILYDPRRGLPGTFVHMMDGTPPPGYHTWHAYIRAFQLLDIDKEYWGRFDPSLAVGWAVQSVAKPAQDAYNTPLPPSQVAEIVEKYLWMTPDQLDEAFMSFPYPPGVS